MATETKTRRRIRLIVGNRRSGESVPAVIACNDYLRLGPNRSVTALWRNYMESSELHETRQPSLSKGTIEKWCCMWSWRERAEEYDAEQDERRQIEHERTLNAGLARQDERLKALIAKADMLGKEVDDAQKRWIDKGETIGYGPSAEGRWVKTLNWQLIKEWRECLGDIAAEVGARRKPSIEIDQMQISVKGYSMVASDGKTPFLGPDAWPAIEAGSKPDPEPGSE